MRKTTKKKIAPIVITAAVVLYVGPLVLALLAAMGGLFEEGGFFPLIGGAVVVGVIKALLQRLDEIDGGEEEEASRY